MFKRRLISMALVMVMLSAFTPTKVFASDERLATFAGANSFAAAVRSDGSVWVVDTRAKSFSGIDGPANALRKLPDIDNAIEVAVLGNEPGYEVLYILKNDKSLWLHSRPYAEGSGNLTKIMDNVIHIKTEGTYLYAIDTNNDLWQESWEGLSKIMSDVADVTSYGDFVIKTDGSVWSLDSDPKKIMDDVIQIQEHAGLYALKKDGSLWIWGLSKYNYDNAGTPVYGEVRTGESSVEEGIVGYNFSTPHRIDDGIITLTSGIFGLVVKKSDNTVWRIGFGWNDNSEVILEKEQLDIDNDVVHIACPVGSYGLCNRLLYMRSDGSLWVYGERIYEDSDWNTFDNVKLADGVKLPSIKTATPSVSDTVTQTPVTNSEYIYDDIDPGASVVLPVDNLATVTDKDTAVSAVQAAAIGMTAEQKQSATGIDLLTLYAEEAVAQAASSTISSSNITIDQSSIQSLQTIANDVKAAVGQTLASSGVTTQRELNANVKFKTADSSSVTITIDPSAANTTADNVRVETPAYALTFSAESIKANAGDSPLIISITESGGSTASTMSTSYVNLLAPTDTNSAYSFLPSNTGGYGTAVFLASTNTKTYNISFNKPVGENVKVSLPPASGNPTYQAVTNSKGDAVGGKYNPVTSTLDVKISASDTYTVKENKKNFSDISGKSNEMQNAINVLASKGIISGTSSTTFSPDSSITRAEIAALITRTLSKFDANADGGFSDVSRSDWFFAACGSAKKHNIMSGTSATTFAPKVNIPKDQIICVAARVLRIEMRYNNPANIDSVLNAYKDASSFADWSRTDLALATRENLVVKRNDGNFNPTTTMTRGDAAIILYRMFMKIW